MPAVSTAQRRLMAIAEHHPEQVNPENRGVLQMSHEQLHDFAAVKERGMPHHKKPAKKKTHTPSAFYGE
jgi:hypothetical protein